MKETVTLIGFGEAGQNIAGGLIEEGGASVRVYDMRFTGAADDSLAERARSMQAEPYCDLQEAVAGARIVFSLVVGAAAVPVGADVAPFLTSEQIFIDLNSVSPTTKRKVGAELKDPASFVEGAVMARVPPYRHKVPILLAGKRAAEAAAFLNGIGMVTEDVGDTPGQASSNKMPRSIMIKGIEALLLECLMAAKKEGIEERVIDSISETFPGIDWRETATYYLGRTALHGARRVTEMNESATTVSEIGLEPMMSSAAAKRIGEAYEIFKAKASGPEDASDYSRILSVLSSA